MHKYQKLLICINQPSKPETYSYFRKWTGPEGAGTHRRIFMTKLYLSLPWREIIFVTFCVVTGIQLMYYGWFFRRLAFFKPNSSDQSQQHPVSVIICARAEAAK